MAPPRATRSSRPRSPPDRVAATRSCPSSGSSPASAPSAATARCAGRGSPRISRAYFGTPMSPWKGRLRSHHATPQGLPKRRLPSQTKNPEEKEELQTLKKQAAPKKKTVRGRRAGAAAQQPRVPLHPLRHFSKRVSKMQPNQRQPRGTPPPFLDELNTLFGSLSRDTWESMWPGVLGDATRTPPRMPQEHIGPSSVGMSSKRQSREQIVTSRLKKKSKDLGEYFHCISESIAARSCEGKSREQEEQSEVMRILREDGVPDGSELYFRALILFQKPACRAQFMNIKERDNRIKYIEWTWTYSKLNGNK